jgi:hypothetical protein
MIRAEEYPVTLSRDKGLWRSPASAMWLEKLSFVVPKQHFPYLLSFYSRCDGFEAGSYDQNSKISMWPIKRVLETLQQTNSFIIGDYFFDADFVEISLKSANATVFLKESKLLLSSNISSFFKRF